MELNTRVGDMQIMDILALYICAFWFLDNSSGFVNKGFLEWKIKKEGPIGPSLYKWYQLRYYPLIIRL